MTVQTEATYCTIIQISEVSLSLCSIRCRWESSREKFQKRKNPHLSLRLSSRKKSTIRTQAMRTQMKAHQVNRSLKCHLPNNHNHQPNNSHNSNKVGNNSKVPKPNPTFHKHSSPSKEWVSSKMRWFH